MRTPALDPSLRFRPVAPHRARVGDNGATFMTFGHRHAMNIAFASPSPLLPEKSQPRSDLYFLNFASAAHPAGHR